MFLKIYKLDHVKLLSVPGLAWQAALKKTKAKLNLLTDITNFLVVEKGIRGGKLHSIYRYAKVNNKYIKYCNKNKESSYIQYWNTNILCRKMSQNFPVNNFD